MSVADSAFDGQRRVQRLIAAYRSVPPTGLILVGIVSVQVGAALAKRLFVALPPDAVVMIRLVTAAVMLGVIARPRLRGHSWYDLGLAATFGTVLAVMNFSIYQAFARIPLGVAVTIEFLGPLTLSVVTSRRRLDLLWVLLAGAGVVLLTRGGGAISTIGVAFAALAGACWAAYIVLSAATGRRFPGTSGLALAMALGAVLSAPLGIARGGAHLLDPGLLAIGAGVGLLSSVIPYTLELEALRRVPARVFGILMSMEPAVAALVGVVLLGETLAGRQWLAIGLVIVACAGATRGRAEG